MCREQSVEQINKDLDRTFPGHPLMDDSGKDALREILVAFSLHKPEIGYCQVTHAQDFMSSQECVGNEFHFWSLVTV